MSLNVMITFVLLALTPCLYADITDDLIVQLPDGKIRGTVGLSGNGTEYYVYNQIPYAAAPIDERRFKDPEDPEPWDDVLDGTQVTKQCPQSLSVGRRLEFPMESEDCLYLTVNTPLKPATEGNLPVLLFIHGGAFMTGSIAFFSPKYFMDYDVIVVLIQYRLGPFGFLSTEDGVIPANLGLKDQRKAINWVHSNIERFGGDPDKITIMGESAGAISVSYLLLDLSLEGKFRAAVQQSGSSAMRLTLIQNPKHYAYELGTLLDNSFTSDNSSQDLLNLLQKSSTDKVNNAGTEVMTAMANEGVGSVGAMYQVPWALVLENEELEKDPMVTAPILHSFLMGNFIKVPTVISFNSEECILNALQARNKPTISKSYDEDPSLLADPRLEIPPENATAFGEEVIKFYTDSSLEEDFGAYIRYTTDAAFVNGILAQANLSWPHTPVYIYEFSYAGDVLGTYFYDMLGFNRTWIPGTGAVAHGEDLMYDFDTIFSTTEEATESDLLTRRRFLKLLTNFVKYLNGTPEEDEELNNVIWPKVTSDELEYLNINNTLEIKTNPRNFRGISDIYNKYVGVKSVW